MFGEKPKFNSMQDGFSSVLSASAKDNKSGGPCFSPASFDGSPVDGELVVPNLNTFLHTSACYVARDGPARQLSVSSYSVFRWGESGELCGESLGGREISLGQSEQDVDEV